MRDCLQGKELTTPFLGPQRKEGLSQSKEKASAVLPVHKIQYYLLCDRPQRKKGLNDSI